MAEKLRYYRAVACTLCLDETPEGTLIVAGLDAERAKKVYDALREVYGAGDEFRPFLLKPVTIVSGHPDLSGVECRMDERTRRILDEQTARRVDIEAQQPAEGR